MAGIRESLDLDITQALNRVKQLETALAKATGGSRGAPAAPPAPATPGGTGGPGGGTLGGLASAFAAQRIFKSLTSAIGSAVSAASELNEQISASEVVFGQAAPEIQKFSDAAADIGLAKDEALAAANNFGALFTALGISQDKAAQLGPTLIQRAADLASFRNIAGGTNEVITRLSSGIVGEVEPLRRLGIAINESTVKQKALSMGAVEVNGQLSESAKVQARIALILDQSSIAQGDFARTSDGLANSQRKLAAEFRNVQIEVGQRFLPVAAEGVKSIHSMLSLFTALPGPVQTIVVALAGIAAAAVGIGLAALAVQRLSGALVQAGIAGGIASTALRGLAIGGGVLFGIAALVTLVRSLGHEAKSTAEDVRDLSRATDEQLAKQFQNLTADRPKDQGVVDRVADRFVSDPIRTVLGVSKTNTDLEKRIKLEERFQAIAKESLPLARSIRDVLKGQGEDVSFLNETIDKEAVAQGRANQRTGEAATVTAAAAEQVNGLEQALKDTATQLDEIFGRFLDAESASNSLTDAVMGLGKELGSGRAKGESLLEFNQRLGESLLTVVGKIESYVAAEAAAGKIAPGVASQQAEIRRQLLLVADAFPELRTQIQTYLDLLGQVPSDVTTTVHVVMDNPFGGADPSGGFAPGTVLVPPDSLVPGAAEAGRNAGQAAAQAIADEIPKSLRQSAPSGLDIGGFILSGINLGPALDKVLASNMLLAAATGKVQEVIAASKFDPSEQLAILNAVKAVDEAVQALNVATFTYGKNSLEAAIATQDLANKRADLNQTILDGIDATKTINDLLEEEKKKMDDLTASVNASSGALSALRRIEDARDAARKAAKDAEKETSRLGQFDQRIAEAKAELADIRAGGGTGSLDEARAEATLRDLELRRKKQVEKVTDANAAAVDANLALVDSTLALAQAGLDLQNRLPGWQEFFVGVATSAGLSMSAIWLLVDSLKVAADAAQRTRALVAGAAAPVQLASAGTTTTATQSFTKTAASTSGGIHVDQIGPIYETTDGRGTAIEIADELKAVALLGA